VTLFSQYCRSQFTVEPVEVIQADGSVVVYPELQYWNLPVSIADINGKVGLNLPRPEIIHLLRKMCLDIHEDANQDANTLIVCVPPTRHDILHACDVIEDVAVAYGYNKIPKQPLSTLTVAKQLPINKLTDLLRQEIVAAGFTEALTFSLCSRDDISLKLRRPDGVDNAVKIMNPKTLEFQVVRTTLLPGILKTISYNKDMPLPLRLFEIQDILVKDPSKDVGSRNHRQFCAVFYGKTSGFEIIHGLLDRMMQLLRVPFDPNSTKGYCIRACEDPTYFDGRCASVRGPSDIELGRLGVIHPDVLKAFDLTMPCSAVDITIEPFL